MNYNQTLFESLSIADSERIHSQVIAWVFNLPNCVLSQKVKTNALKELFSLSNTKGEEIGEIESCQTEVEKIDILIITKNYVFVIENKLKSSEHTDQTNRYKKYIESKIVNEERKPTYGFLSLIEDKPKEEYWVTISYEKLHEVMNKCLAEINNEKKEYYFLSDYLETVGNLVNAYKSFKTEKDVLKYVFSKKEKKDFIKAVLREEENLNITIIRKNRLETIFQKAFFSDLCKKMNLEDYQIDEKHGYALFNYKLRCFEVKGKKYEIAFVMQGTTLKTTLSIDNYGKSKKEDIVFLIKLFKETFEGTNGFTKFNEPQTRGRISVTKKLGEEKIFDLNFDVLSESVKKEVELATVLAKKFIDNM